MMEDDVTGADCTLCNKTVLSKTLSCGHTFHIKCIDDWLANHTTCPTCRGSYEPTATSRQSVTLDCPVCLEDIKGTRVLECGHAFHQDCINERLLESSHCPVCLVTVNEFDLTVCNFCDEPVLDREWTLPCGHTFHMICVSCHLKQQKNCPECGMPAEWEDAEGLQSSSGTSCAFCSKEVPRSSEVVKKCGHIFHEQCSVVSDPCSECSKEDHECLFCYKRITDDSMTLRCGHEFHGNCVAPWLEEQKICPECTAPAEECQELSQCACQCCGMPTEGDETTLPCGHRFHKLCAGSWNKCPECLLPFNDTELPTDPCCSRQLLVVEFEPQNSATSSATSCARETPENTLSASDVSEPNSDPGLDILPDGMETYQDLCRPQNRSPTATPEEPILLDEREPEEPSVSSSGQSQPTNNTSDKGYSTSVESSTTRQTTTTDPQASDYTSESDSDPSDSTSQVPCASSCTDNGRTTLNRPDDTNCPICSERIEDNGLTVPCGHTFHRACLAALLSEQDP